MICQFQDYVVSMMMVWIMNLEQLVEWELKGRTEVLKENPLHCHLVHHKSNIIWSEMKPVLGEWEASS